jgi:hypothetical protein
MTSSFTTNKQIEKPAYQDYSSDPTGWTVPINDDWDIIDNAFGGTVSIALTNVNVTLTTTQCQNVHIKFTGALSGNVIVYFPATISGFFIVDNATTGAYTVVLRNAGGSPGDDVLAVQDANTFVWVDQATASVYLADNSPVTGGNGINITSGSVINLTAPVSVANGGTGTTTYTAGQLLIGNNAGGLTPATLTAGSNITVTNGNGAITIAATGSAGGVTTFSAGTTGFTPNTNTAGAVTLDGVLNVANGGTGLSTMTAANRALYSTSASAITAGTLPVAAGGTGATDAATARSNLSAAGSGAVTGSGLTVATGRLLGRTTAGTGAIEEISAGTGLSLSGGSIAVSNSGVSAGTYTNATVTVDATGRVTSASSGSGSAVSSVSASSSASGFSLSASPSTGAVGLTFGISSDNNARSSLGLGSIATQDANNINISGGKILLSTGTGSSVGYAFSSGNASWQSTGSDAFFNFTTGTSIYSTSSGATISANVGGAAAFYVSTSLFEVQVANAAKPGGGSWLASSDIRVKKNVQDYTLSAEALLTLRPVTYQYNGLYGTPNNGVVYTGLIAQEVENTPFSSMVGTYNYEGTQLLNLDTSQLVYALINAVQDLTARVKALEAK